MCIVFIINQFKVLPTNYSSTIDLFLNLDHIRFSFLQFFWIIFIGTNYHFSGFILSIEFDYCNDNKKPNEIFHLLHKTRFKVKIRSMYCTLIVIILQTSWPVLSPVIKNRLQLFSSQSADHFLGALVSTVNLYKIWLLPNGRLDNGGFYDAVWGQFFYSQYYDNNRVISPL